MTSPFVFFEYHQCTVENRWNMWQTDWTMTCASQISETIPCTCFNTMEQNWRTNQVYCRLWTTSTLLRWYMEYTTCLVVALARLWVVDGEGAFLEAYPRSLGWIYKQESLSTVNHFGCTLNNSYLFLHYFISPPLSTILPSIDSSHHRSKCCVLRGPWWTVATFHVWVYPFVRLTVSRWARISYFLIWSCPQPFTHTLKQ